MLQIEIIVLKFIGTYKCWFFIKDICFSLLSMSAMEASRIKLEQTSLSNEIENALA
jgi:hypothetical protein